MLVDGHAHILEPSSPFSQNLNGDPELLLRMLDEASMDQAVVFGIAPYDRNEFVAETCARYPQRLVGFASVQPTAGDYADRQAAVSRLRKSLSLYAFKGVKLHPRIQAFCLTDPHHIPLFQSIAQFDLPVLIDCISQPSTVPLGDNLPFEVDRLLRCVPGLKVILAHMGGHRVLDAYCVALSHPNVYLDLAWVLHLYHGSSVEQDIKFVVSKLAPLGRIIFGSDFPIFDRTNTLPISVSKDMCLHMFEEIGLDEQATSDAMGGTISRLLGLE
jgi:predicted TIM-barrel fold metal-dependent hydrolase